MAAFLYKVVAAAAGVGGGGRQTESRYGVRNVSALLASGIVAALV